MSSISSWIIHRQMPFCLLAINTFANAVIVIVQVCHHAYMMRWIQVSATFSFFCVICFIRATNKRDTSQKKREFYIYLPIVLKSTWCVIIQYNTVTSLTDRASPVTSKHNIKKKKTFLFRFSCRERESCSISPTSMKRKKSHTEVVTSVLDSFLQRKLSWMCLSSLQKQPQKTSFQREVFENHRWAETEAMG